MLNGSVLPRVLALLAACLPASIGGQVTPSRQVAPEDRVTPAQFRAMVAGPLRLLDRGDVAGAAAAFDALLADATARYGALSLDVADRLTAFGLMLFLSDAADSKQRSPEYLRRAIPVYRAVFGADSAEVALAIGTYVDVAMQLWPDDPPRDLDAALEDEYRIRVATRGPTDGVTMLAFFHLAEVRGTLSRTRGETARIEAVADMFRQAIRILEPKPYVPDEPTLFAGYFGMARMYVRNGRMAEARAAVIEARDHYRRNHSEHGEMCSAIAAQYRRFASFLVERGHSNLSEELDALLSDVSCFDNALRALTEQR